MSDWQTEWFHSDRPRTRPFLKWAGGKRRLVDELLKLIGPLPEDSTYFEPFLGSGALYFAIAPPRAVLSDLNEPLIESYRLVKGRTAELCALLATLPGKPTRDQYYTIRDRFNDLLSQKTALTADQRLTLGSLFVWLNHTCFNGLYRVNRSGQFNVPIGSNPEPYIFDKKTIEAAGRALRASKTELLSADYKTVLSKATEGDCIYFDPPYEPIEGEPGFTSYTRFGFTILDQQELASSVFELAEKGVRVLVSNSDSVAIRSLYKKHRVHFLRAPRSISRDPSGRRPVREVVIVA